MKDLIYLLKFKSSIKYKILYSYSLLRKIISKLIFWKFKSSYIETNKDYIIENTNWIYKIYEPSDMHAILKTNNEDELNKFFKMDWWIFIDIWWNVGKYSIIIWKQNKDNIIYTFEPNKYLFDNYLLENIKLNNSGNIYPLNVWLSDKKWIVTLYVPEWNDFGCSSIIKDRNIKSKELNIILETLDDFIINKNISIKEIKLIKIDVEWNELSVLKWWINLLKNSNNIRIIIEISDNFDEINKILSDNSFKKVFNKGVNYIYEKTI